MMHRFKDDVDAAMDALHRELDELKIGGATSQPAAAASMLSMVNATTADAEDLQETLQESIDRQAPGNREKLVGWFQDLFKTLKKASRHLWELIRGLLRPKEWAVKGEIKAVPGFAKAEIEIKFGPDPAIQFQAPSPA
jgi:hypothetical protein